MRGRTLLKRREVDRSDMYREGTSSEGNRERKRGEKFEMRGNRGRKRNRGKKSEASEKRKRKEI